MLLMIEKGITLKCLINGQGGRGGDWNFKKSINIGNE